MLQVRLDLKRFKREAFMRNKSPEFKLGTQYMGCASVRAEGHRGGDPQVQFPSAQRTHGRAYPLMFAEDGS